MNVSVVPINEMMQTSVLFPPSYANNPLIFGGAIASMLYVTMMSLATNIRMCTTVWSSRRRGVSWTHTMMLHRLFILGILWCLILTMLPDVVVSLAWGDPRVTAEILSTMLIVDKFFDILAALPFMAGMTCLWLASKGMTMFMVAEATAVDFRVTWPTLRVPLRMAGVVLIISILVTVGKWAWSV